MCLWFVPTTFSGPKKEIPVPLKSIKVEATILDAIARVDILQYFVNSETTPIEAV